MGIARDFTGQIAYLALAKNAQRWSKLAVFQFDNEKAGGPLLARNRDDDENPLNRMETVFGFRAFEHDKARGDYLWCLAGILLLSHYKYAHNEPQHDHAIFELQVVAAESAGKYTDIDAVLTPEQAADPEVASNWD
ncbi:MAG: hypothetical protein WC477_06285 [Patescibacteria group bacterium]